MNEYTGRSSGEGRRYALVVSRFNELVTERLEAGARGCLIQHGSREQDIDVFRVPGAWELPQAVRQVVETGRYDGVVALGCVVRGETPHFEYVAGEAARGLGALARDSAVPITFGVLTTDTTEQALARAGGKSGNKGWESALAVLELADLFRRIRGEGAGT